MSVSVLALSVVQDALVCSRDKQSTINTSRVLFFNLTNVILD